jgi:hypothetical protein
MDDMERQDLIAGALFLAAWIILILAAIFG